MKSIIQTRKICFVCGKTTGIHDHHVFGGSNRKLSEQHGLKIWLCPEHHNMSKSGIHFNKQLDLSVKCHAERIWLEKNKATIDDFIQIFGKNYL